MQRNTFGMGVPLRIAMEKKIVSEVSTWSHLAAGRLERGKLGRRLQVRTDMQDLHHPLLLASSSGAVPLGGSHNIAQEILNGTDESLDAPDFMAGSTTYNEVLDMSAVMERSRGI
jgi:proteasome maturation protein